MNDEKLFLESMAYIKANLDVTFDQVPEHLIAYWQMDDVFGSSDEELPATKQWGVFMYALLLYKERKSEMEFKMEIEAFIDLFKTWQTFVALAEVARKTDINIKPVKLFDFDNFDGEIEILE